MKKGYALALCIASWITNIYKLIPVIFALSTGLQYPIFPWMHITFNPFGKFLQTAASPLALLTYHILCALFAVTATTIYILSRTESRASLFRQSHNFFCLTLIPIVVFLGDVDWVVAFLINSILLGILHTLVVLDYPELYLITICIPVILEISLMVINIIWVVIVTGAIRIM